MPPAASARPRSSQYHVPNLERALGILELLAQHPAGLGLSDIAQVLNVSKNSVFRITQTLLAHGYLQRDDETRHFALTHKMLMLGYSALSEHNVVEMALDIMRELRDAVKETVLIGALAGTEGVVLEQVPGSHPFKFMVDPGTHFPLHADAPGKAMLAFLPNGEAERILRRTTLTRFTSRTITDVQTLLNEMRRIRECGYALDRAEMIEGCHCVSAPVLNHHGYPVAAIWTTGPADRLREGDFAAVGRQVAEHAKRISRRLGDGVLKV